MIRVYDVGFDTTGATVASIQADGLLQTATMQTAAAGGYDVAMVSTGKTSQQVQTVLVDIQARILAGETTPVLASHLDALGLRDAVEQWARAAQ